ncbi:hypothetical protein GCM10018953_38410 [Streptosporangium nondiastaticum]
MNGWTIMPTRFTSVPAHSAQNGRGRPPSFDRRKPGEPGEPDGEPGPARVVLVMTAGLDRRAAGRESFSRA